MRRWIVVVLAAASSACGLLLGDLSNGSEDDDGPSRGGESGGDRSGGDGDLVVSSTSNGGGDGNGGTVTTPNPSGPVVPSDPANADSGGGTPVPPPKDAGGGTPTCVEKSASLSPASVRQESDGAASWSSMEAALLSGPSGFAVAQFEGTARSNRLVFGDFGANIPANAQIRGFRATVFHLRGADMTFSVPTLRISGRELKKETNASLWNYSTSFGGENDLWTTGPVAANALGTMEFAFGVQGTAGGAGTRTASIDRVAVTVRFCVPQ